MGRGIMSKRGDLSGFAIPARTKGTLERLSWPPPRSLSVQMPQFLDTPRNFPLGMAPDHQEAEMEPRGRHQLHSPLYLTDMGRRRVKVRIPGALTDHSNKDDLTDNQ